MEVIHLGIVKIRKLKNLNSRMALPQRSLFAVAPTTLPRHCCLQRFAAIYSWWCHCL